MSTDKETVEMPPTYTVNNIEPQGKSKWWQNKKKSIAIGSVTAVIIAGLALTAVLVSVYWVTEAQKEIVKFNLEFKGKDGETSKQDVTSDPNANVVTYHVTRGDQDVHIVDDFNQGIQTVKIQGKSATNCFAMPLNRSAAAEPSAITEIETWKNGSAEVNQYLVMEPTPVSNRAFLSKTAATMCQDVSLYWAFRSCGTQDVKKTSTAAPGQRKKRYLCYQCCYDYCWKVWFVKYCDCISCWTRC
jgi:hypothetical protein